MFMSMYEDLDKLHKLKENGVITEEEYELEKKRLLQDRNSKEQNQNIGIILLRVLCFILGFIVMCWSIGIIGAIITTIIIAVVCLIIGSQKK